MSSASHRQFIASDRKRNFPAPDIFTAMKKQMKALMSISRMLSVAALVQTSALADDQTTSALTSTNSSVAPDTRYGLFNGLDHRSWYSQGDFPEPFLVDDSGLEINEARLDWVHTKAGAQHSNTVTAEVEKGFGLLTLEIEVPYQRDH